LQAILLWQQGAWGTHRSSPIRKSFKFLWGSLTRSLFGVPAQPTSWSMVVSVDSLIKSIEISSWFPTTLTPTSCSSMRFDSVAMEIDQQQVLGPIAAGLRGPQGEGQIVRGWADWLHEVRTLKHSSEQFDAEKAKLRPGERLSVDRAQEITLDVLRKVRAAQHRGNQRYIHWWRL
jgi:hypothetical protein